MVTTSVDSRLQELGLVLPVVEPMGSYVPGRIAGDLVHVSGQGPFREDGSVPSGVIGADVDVETARQYARETAIRLLAEAQAVCGTLNDITAVVQLFGTLRAVPEFEDHVTVMNAASELMLEVLGTSVGPHARMVVGVASLPFGMPLELSAVFGIDDRATAPLTTTSGEGIERTAAD